SPIDPQRFTKIKDTSPAHLLDAYLPSSESPTNPTGIGPTEDDISQLWLAHSSDTLTAVGILETNATAAGIGQIFYGPSLETMFNAAGLPPNGDRRTPEIIVHPHVRPLFTGHCHTQADHGGYRQE